MATEYAESRIAKESPLGVMYEEMLAASLKCAHHKVSTMLIVSVAANVLGEMLALATVEGHLEATLAETMGTVRLAAEREAAKLNKAYRATEH